MSSEKRDSAGMAAARRAARWHIGDYMWADMIIDAYFNPERANAALDKEQKE